LFESTNAERFTSLAAELGVPGAADEALAELRGGLERGETVDWVASRGEHISARVIAAAAGARFIETGQVLGIDSRGLPTPESYDRLAAVLAGDDLCLIPGYYGQGPDGRVKVFSRGGSDITGAVVARAAGATVYENWTDVSGFMMADPRLVPDARPMREVTYAELRELSYMGASVLHEEAIFPVKEAGIPINIRNTNAPQEPGTMIVPQREATETPVVGVAGKPSFSVIYLYKNLMNKELGFGRRVLGILESHGVSYEHTPTGIDSMSVVVADDELGDRADALREELVQSLHVEECSIASDLALVTVVGVGMAHQVGIAARCFGALAEAGVNVRMISQGVGELNIVVGVAREDFGPAVNALYHAFVKPLTA
ncbi:MAG: aspartate kinase, partial [Armatimonadetes bacterium]|nr:aspartate kinase [Armatimonadota bacterium]